MCVHPFSYERLDQNHLINLTQIRFEFAILLDVSIVKQKDIVSLKHFVPAAAVVRCVLSALVHMHGADVHMHGDDVCTCTVLMCASVHGADVCKRAQC